MALDDLAVLADDGAAASDEALAGRLGFAAEQALRFSFCHIRLLSIVVCRDGRFGRWIFSAGALPGERFAGPFQRKGLPGVRPGEPD